MAKVKGKSAVVITVLSNPAVRRAVIKGATKAAGSAAAFAATRAEKSKAPAAGAMPSPAQPETTPPGPAAGKTASLGETVAVESIVTSVAKPLADRLAASSNGRSVLQAINSISGQALGAAPKRGGAAVAGFVGNILAGQGAHKPAQAEAQPAVKFTPVKPPSTPAPPVPTMQWPPPKSSD